ncbi:MAG: protein kinase domain-containing protein [Vicinamibacteria bacterium]
MVGSTVSHYRILEKLGQGGMGEVYLADDTKLHRKVALKFLPENLTRDESRKQRFIQEARAAASMEHPHIAAIYDIGDVDGRTFIVMEYVRGASLRDAISEGKLGVRRSLELANQIAEALAKAHERGVVHRDLKPENVLLSEDGYAKIIDFGLAKLGEPRPADDRENTVEHEAETLIKTQDGLLLGTVAYMSPEQARAKPVDAQTDVFSLGVVMQEMLTGSSPFQRPSVAETLSAILKESPHPLPEDVTALAPALPSILRQALAKEPSGRYQRMRDLANDIRALREEMGSGARPSFRSSTSSILRNGVLAAFALALVFATSFFFSRDAQPTGIGASGRPAIAVMYFEDNTGSEEIRWLAKGLPNMLVTDLAQTPGLDVVSRQRIQEILRQIGKDELEAIDASLVPEIARRAGAGAVVGGSIYKLDDQIRIDVQVEDVGSGRILSAHSVRGNDVFPLVDELTGRIRDSLNMTKAPLERGIAEVTTASLEAYRHYVEGLEASRNFRWADAREHLERAVEIDPSFAIAKFELYYLAPLWGDATLVETYRKKVSEHLDRLPERQRLFIEAHFARHDDNDPERARDLLEELLIRYPDEADAYTNLAMVYNGPLNEPQKALETLARGTAAVPMAGTVHNQYAYYLLYAGRYQEAFRELDTYAELNPEEPNPFDSMGEAYLFTGQPAKALESYARALEVDPTFFNAHTGRAWGFAMLGRYDEAREEIAEREKGIATAGFRTLQPVTAFLGAFIDSREGRYREAQKQIALGLQLAESLDQAESVVPLLLLEASLALERGDYAQTLGATRRALELIPELEDAQQRTAQTLFTQLLAGTAEARSGDVSSARERWEAQRDVSGPKQLLLNFAFHALEGEIALAEGDLPTAAAAFSAAEPEIKMHLHMTRPVESLAVNNPPMRDGLARVKVAQGDLAGAIEIYRSLLTPDVESKWTAMLEPRYVLALARLLDQTGNTAAARAEYQRFLDLWKHADPELRELAEARAYLARTATTSS